MDKKFSGVLLASDFDDTLLNSRERVSGENYEAIEYFIARGGKFTVATGRALPAFEGHYSEAPINAPVVLSNGAMIYDFDKKETLYSSQLPMRSAEDCMELVQRIPEVAFEAYHGEDIYAYNPNFITYNHLRKVGVSCSVRPVREMPLPWVKLIYEHDTPVLERVAEYYAKNWPERYEVVFSNRYLLEVTAHGCNKGSSVLRVAERLGIGREHIYTAGDNKNDIPMFRVAKLGFAPSDCAEALLDCGAKIVSSCDEHCIRDIIDYLDGIY